VKSNARFAVLFSQSKPAQRLLCESEEQQNERTASFYKKLAASDMALAASWYG